MRRAASPMIVLVFLISWASPSTPAPAGGETPASTPQAAPAAAGGETPTSAPAATVAGLVSVPSDHDVATTADRLVAAIEQKGARVFARIDHGANAASVGNPLAPMQLVIFGRAEMGTALMQAGATVGIDLPLKVLVWQDADGQVWLAYNDPGYLAERHHLAGAEPVVAKMRQVLEGLTAAAR